MLQQILKFSNTSKVKKDVKSSSHQPAVVKRKRAKPPANENVYIGIEEPASKSRRIKVTSVKNHNGIGNRKKSTNAADRSALNEFNAMDHASPKIWDIFERFQNFNQRKVLTRHLSGLLDACDEVTANHPQLNTQSDEKDENDVRRETGKNRRQTTEPCPISDDEPLMGGDRKRRCIETCDYGDEVHCTGKMEAQPASAFKPKCLNFDDVDDS